MLEPSDHQIPDIFLRSFPEIDEELDKHPQGFRIWDRIRVYGVVLTSGGIAASSIAEDPLLATSIFLGGIFVGHQIWGISPADPASLGDIVA